MYVCMYVCIYIYIYIYMSIGSIIVGFRLLACNKVGLGSLQGCYILGG